MGTTGAQYMSYDRYSKTAHKGAFGSSFIVAGTAIKTSDLGGFANARLDLFGPEIAVTDPLHAITLTSTDFFL
jgi:hypothetical protein